MTTVEDRLKFLIGELHFQNAILASRLEEAQARIDLLTKEKDSPPPAPKD